MEQLFTKAQLKEMVQDRIKWMDNSYDGLREICPDSTTVCYNFNCYPNRPNRFTKAQIVKAIRALDTLRAQRLS